MKEYENATPIADGLIVLDLLYTDRWEYKTDRRLLLPWARSKAEPYVRVEGYGVRDYCVAIGLGELLLARMLVEGHKHWGYTDDHELAISDVGRQLIRDTYERVGVPYDDHFTGRLRFEHWVREVA